MISSSASAAPTSGARDVTVTNTDAQADTLTGAFTVNAKPTLTSASPDDRGQGATSQSIVLAGTGFVTLPVAIFQNVRYGVDPVITAIATLLTAATALLLALNLAIRRAQ